MLTARRIVGYIVTAFWIALFLLAIRAVSSQIIQWLRKKMNSMDGVEVEPMQGALWADLMRLMRFILNKFNTIYNLTINRLRTLLGMGRDKTESFSIRKPEPVTKTIYFSFHHRTGPEVSTETVSFELEKKSTQLWDLNPPEEISERMIMILFSQKDSGITDH